MAKNTDDKTAELEKKIKDTKYSGTQKKFFQYYQFAIDKLDQMVKAHEAYEDSIGDEKNYSEIEKNYNANKMPSDRRESLENEKKTPSERKKELLDKLKDIEELIKINDKSTDKLIDTILEPNNEDTIKKHLENLQLSLEQPIAKFKADNKIKDPVLNVSQTEIPPLPNGINDLSLGSPATLTPPPIPPRDQQPSSNPIAEKKRLELQQKIDDKSGRYTQAEINFFKLYVAVTKEKNPHSAVDAPEPHQLTIVFQEIENLIEETKNPENKGKVDLSEELKKMTQKLEYNNKNNPGYYPLRYPFDINKFQKALQAPKNTVTTPGVVETSAISEITPTPIKIPTDLTPPVIDPSIAPPPLNVPRINPTLEKKTEMPSYTQQEAAFFKASNKFKNMDDEDKRLLFDDAGRELETQIKDFTSILNDVNKLIEQSKGKLDLSKLLTEIAETINSDEAISSEDLNSFKQSIKLQQNKLETTNRSRSMDLNSSLRDSRDLSPTKRDTTYSKQNADYLKAREKEVAQIAPGYQKGFAEIITKYNALEDTNSLIQDFNSVFDLIKEQSAIKNKYDKLDNSGKKKKNSKNTQPENTLNKEAKAHLKANQEAITDNITALISKFNIHLQYNAYSTDNSKSDAIAFLNAYQKAITNYYFENGFNNIHAKQLDDKTLEAYANINKHISQMLEGTMSEKDESKFKEFLSNYNGGLTAQDIKNMPEEYKEFLSEPKEGTTKVAKQTVTPTTEATISPNPPLSPPPAIPTIPETGRRPSMEIQREIKVNLGSAPTSLADSFKLTLSKSIEEKFQAPLGDEYIKLHEKEKQELIARINNASLADLMNQESQISKDISKFNKGLDEQIAKVQGAAFNTMYEMLKERSENNESFKPILEKFEKSTDASQEVKDKLLKEAGEVLKGNKTTPKDNETTPVLTGSAKEKITESSTSLKSAIKDQAASLFKTVQKAKNKMNKKIFQKKEDEGDDLDKNEAFDAESKRQALETAQKKEATALLDIEEAKNKEQKLETSSSSEKTQEETKNKAPDDAKIKLQKMLLVLESMKLGNTPEGIEAINNIQDTIKLHIDSKVIPDSMITKIAQSINHEIEAHTKTFKEKNWFGPDYKAVEFDVDGSISDIDIKSNLRNNINSFCSKNDIKDSYKNILIGNLNKLSKDSYAKEDFDGLMNDFKTLNGLRKENTVNLETPKTTIPVVQPVNIETAEPKQEEPTSKLTPEYSNAKSRIEFLVTNKNDKSLEQHKDDLDSIEKSLKILDKMGDQIDITVQQNVTKILDNIWNSDELSKFKEIRKKEIAGLAIAERQEVQTQIVKQQREAELEELIADMGLINRNEGKAGDDETNGEESQPAQDGVEKSIAVKQAKIEMFNIFNSNESFGERAIKMSAAFTELPQNLKTNPELNSFFDKLNRLIEQPANASLTDIRERLNMTDPKQISEYMQNIDKALNKELDHLNQLLEKKDIDGFKEHRKNVKEMVHDIGKKYSEYVKGNTNIDKKEAKTIMTNFQKATKEASRQLNVLAHNHELDTKDIKTNIKYKKDNIAVKGIQSVIQGIISGGKHAGSKVKALIINQQNNSKQQSGPGHN